MCKGTWRVAGTAVAVSLGIASGASAAPYFEQAGITTPPAGVTPAEDNGAAPGGFSYVFDVFERTIAGSEPTSLPNFDVIDTIEPRLWTNDADVYEINIVNPNIFSASVTGAHSLVLFDKDGMAMAGVVGGTIDSSWVNKAGTYFLGLGADGSNPRNAAGEDLFTFNGSTPVAPNALADLVLADDPFVAWELNNDPNLVGPGNFTRPGSTVSLTGVRAVLPEPGSIALFGLGALAALRRRTA